MVHWGGWLQTVLWVGIEVMRAKTPTKKPSYSQIPVITRLGSHPNTMYGPKAPARAIDVSSIIRTLAVARRGAATRMPPTRVGVFITRAPAIVLLLLSLYQSGTTEGICDGNSQLVWLSLPYRQSFRPGVHRSMQSTLYQSTAHFVIPHFPAPYRQIFGAAFHRILQLIHMCPTQQAALNKSVLSCVILQHVISPPCLDHIDRPSNPYFSLNLPIFSRIRS